MASETGEIRDVTDWMLPFVRRRYRSHVGLTVATILLALLVTGLAWTTLREAPLVLVLGVCAGVGAILILIWRGPLAAEADEPPVPLTRIEIERMVAQRRLEIEEAEWLLKQVEMRSDPGKPRSLSGAQDVDTMKADALRAYHKRLEAEDLLLRALIIFQELGDVDEPKADMVRALLKQGA